jgi:hypothetical protein
VRRLALARVDDEGASVAIAGGRAATWLGAKRRVGQARRTFDRSQSDRAEDWSEIEAPVVFALASRLHPCGFHTLKDRDRDVGSLEGAHFVAPTRTETRVEESDGFRIDAMSAIESVAAAPRGPGMADDIEIAGRDVLGAQDLFDFGSKSHEIERGPVHTCKAKDR